MTTKIMLLNKKSPVPRIGKLVALPMVPRNITRETVIDGKAFIPGWYCVYVDEKADTYISVDQAAFDKQRDAHILAISWNIGQVGLTVEQCSNVMSLWGQPVLEPSIYRLTIDHALMTDSGRSLLNHRDFHGLPNNYKTVEEALFSVNQASKGSL